MDTRPHIHLRRRLDDLRESPSWPAGVSPVAFDPERHAAEVHGLLEQAYACGGGGVAPFQAWWAGVRDDAEFDPSLVFLAASGAGEVLGVAQCWTSAFIKDLAVAGRWRRRGVGEALLRQVFYAFRERGADHVELKVEADNAAAIRLYGRLGMHPVLP